MPAGQQARDSAHADRRQRGSAGTYVPYHSVESGGPDALSPANMPFDYTDAAASTPGTQSSPFLYEANTLGYYSAGRRDYTTDLSAQWEPPSVSVGAQHSTLWPQDYGSQTITSSYQSYDSIAIPITAPWTSDTTPTSMSTTPPYTQADMLGDLVAASSYFTSAAGDYSAPSSNPGASPNWYSDHQHHQHHHHHRGLSLSPGRDSSAGATPGLSEYDYPSDILSSPPIGTPTSIPQGAPNPYPSPATQPISAPGRQSRSNRSSRSSDSRHDPYHDGDAFIIVQNGVEKRGYHPPDVWDSHKEIIRRLYLDERRPLKDVVQIMDESYGFRATPKMYKTKFTSWGFAKNNTEKEAKQILYHKLMRDAQGKRSAFSRHGKQIDLQRYLRRKGVSEMDLVDFDADGTLPPHVRCWTPP